MAALNTHGAVRDEGNWDFTGWSPRIASSAAMDTFVDGILARVNLLLQEMVGTVWYAAQVSADPWKTLLTEAEMHLAQAELLEAAAAIAESGSDTNPAPFLGTGATLLACADRRRLNATAIIRLHTQKG